MFQNGVTQITLQSPAHSAAKLRVVAQGRGNDGQTFSVEGDTYESVSPSAVTAFLLRTENIPQSAAVARETGPYPVNADGEYTAGLITGTEKAVAFRTDVEFNV